VRYWEIIADKLSKAGDSGDSFVNDYEQTVKGKKTAWRDSFTFTHFSHFGRGYENRGCNDANPDND
jgi:hypothetical protein